jgi:hypothetical protein
MDTKRRIDRVDFRKLTYRRSIIGGVLRDTTKSMTDDNASAAIVASSSDVPQRRRWLQRFALLNAMLIGLPLLLAIIAYAMLAVNGIQISGSSGALGMETALLVAGYIVLPNIIMAIFCAIGRRSRSNANRL